MFGRTSCSSSGVRLAEWLSRFHKEALTFEVFLAKRAVEALRVVVVVESLDPPVPGLDRESARDALRCEQLVPIFFTVGQSVLQIKGAVGEDLVAVGARKALRMEVCGHRLQAVLSFQLDCRPLTPPGVVPENPSKVPKGPDMCLAGSPGCPLGSQGAPQGPPRAWGRGPRPRPCCPRPA